MYVCLCMYLFTGLERQVEGIGYYAALRTDCRRSLQQKKKKDNVTSDVMYVCMCMYEGGSEREYSDRIRF